MFIRYRNDGKGRSVPVAKIYTEKEHHISVSDIDKDALWAIRKIQQNGGEAYIVGGAIRDMIPLVRSSVFSGMPGSSANVSVSSIFSSAAR